MRSGFRFESSRNCVPQSKPGCRLVMRMKPASITVRMRRIGSFQFKVCCANGFLMRGGDNMGFRFWFGRTVVFSAGFFTPTSLATVARIGFYTRGQAARDWFLFGWWLFFNEHPLPGLLATIARIFLG